ncbi:MAG: hypothetical protein PHD10_05135 [Bacilli bacterium]|nr:hypothetical protein [Bacilli bacterium]MDD4608491.1 hypothetical protein [Bacilli bacterium]
MSGTIIIQEPRKTKEKFSSWYEKKFIETGKSKDFEEKFDQAINVATQSVVVAGSAATVALIFCPVDGPFGELCTIAATPVLAKLVEECGKLLKKVVIKDIKRDLIEGTIVQKDGSSESVIIPDGNIVEDAKNISKDLNEFKDTLNKGGKVA